MDERRRILFLMLPFRSHHLASFNYARDLKLKGNDIVYAGVNVLKEFVNGQSFEFHSIEYLFEYKINNFRAFLAFLLTSLADRSFKKKNYRQFCDAYFECRKLVQLYNPAEIYIDEGFSEYYWFFKEFNIPVKFINPNLSTTKVRGLPPLSSGFMPRYNWWSNIICELLWLNNLRKLKIKEYIYKVAFLGCDEIFFWKKFCKKRGWNWKENTDWNHSFYRCVENIDTIILASEQLEFPRDVKVLRETYFHQRIVRNEDQYITDGYLNLLQDLEVRRTNPRFRLVYCTFGTQSVLNRKIEINFIYKLIACIAKEADIFLVISHNEESLQRYNSENVRVLPFIPNLHFLQYANVVISHGGLGTIKECVDASVPLIIYPSNLKGDNLSNANRVEYLGLGVSGNLKTASINSIQEKIYSILNNDFSSAHNNRMFAQPVNVLEFENN